MQVLKRSQITEVVTNRSVYHDLKVGQQLFTRIESQKIVMPFMDCEGYVNESTVIWYEKIAKRVSKKLTAKEVKALGLTDLFDKLNINSKNGN